MNLEEKLKKIKAKSQNESLEIPPRLRVHLSASALVNNYEAIRKSIPGQFILPMLKANAYGHGAIWAAQVLQNQQDLYGFGVATLDEGAQLRSVLEAKEARPFLQKRSLQASLTRRIQPIIVFTETTDWAKEKGNFCEKHALTPVIASERDLKRFVQQGWPEKLPYELQFNTGMNRLGIEMGSIPVVKKMINSLPDEHHPSGVFSHLATSEKPKDPLSQQQLLRFRKIREELRSRLPRTFFHLANSGGIWNQKHFSLSELTDVVRPGLSLYGVPPWSGAPERGIVPVLTLTTRVIAIHQMGPGESIGYGGTFRVKGKDSVFAAILSAGYADGVVRALSNRGSVWLNGKLTRFIGQVSMDLCAIQCESSTQVGDLVEILGPRIDPWDQAKAAGTIPYELFTSLTERIKRFYA